MTPLEVMLDIMRRPIDPKASAELQAGARAMRFEAAKAAAPYMHPRLQAIEHSGELKMSLADSIAALNQSLAGSDSEDRPTTH